MAPGDRRFELMVVGLGGWGSLLIGRLLAEAGAAHYRNVTYFPNYGAAIRGGEAECTVILSEEEVISPIVLQPQAMILMGPVPVSVLERRVAPGGMLLLDSSVTTEKVTRGDLQVYSLPATRAAVALGSQLVTNVIFLGAYLEAAKAMPLEVVEKALEERLAGGRREALIPLNKRALRQGAELAASYKG